MIRINQIKIPIDLNRYEPYPDVEVLKKGLRKKAAGIIKVDEGKIENLEIVKHSIDARKKPELYDIYAVDVRLHGINEAKVLKKCKDKNVSDINVKKYDFLEKVASGFSDADGFQNIDLSALREKIEKCGKKICVIGAGPAGLFCGYELAKAGFKPIVIERGADVDKRLKIVERFWETGELDVRTNVQFGEGGAGTFSDGKLNTMVKDKEGRGQAALDIFVQNGAPSRIKYESKPHIGTDILKDVVKNIRQSIQDAGGEVFFETQVTELVIDEEGNLKGIKVRRQAESTAPGNDSTVINAGSDDNVHSKKNDNLEYIDCDAAVLAIGHSARDTFEMLCEKKVSMQPKAFAIGFRVEHPQSLINRSQYGIENSQALPAAPYKLTTTTGEGRGVYSFCMCPGGYVVNASSEEGMLAVNGMSYSKRDGRNANSAIIITVEPGDFGSDHVLAGVEFQRRLEKKAYELAGGKVPVEYYCDFKTAVTSDKTENSCPQDIKEDFTPQIKGFFEFAAVHEILPDELNKAFVEGMENFGRIIKGYNDDHAAISGVESRTSSPVRITRSDDGQSLNVKGLFPCGEGAGYAGGIMSASMDGIKTAELVAGWLLRNSYIAEE